MKDGRLFQRFGLLCAVLAVLVRLSPYAYAQAIGLYQGVIVGTASSRTGFLDLYSSGAAHRTRIQAADTPTAAVTWKLPAADLGATGFLQSNGSGVLSVVASTAVLPFADNVDLLKDDGDPTKRLQIQLTNVTTGNSVTPFAIRGLGDVELTTGVLYFDDINGFITRTSGSNTMQFAASSAAASMALTAGALSLTPVAAVLRGSTASSGTSFTILSEDRGGNAGAGIPLLLLAGAGSTASTGNVGGDVTLTGGAAGGSAANAGGSIVLAGGAPTSTGAKGGLKLERTITAGGTTGAQTINKMAGTVNFAAAVASLVVTNSNVATTSIVFAVLRTADGTCRLAHVVPAAGSFTITMTAACGAETSVGFWVTN